jgi:hypothetical protein
VKNKAVALSLIQDIRKELSDLGDKPDAKVLAEIVEKSFSLEKLIQDEQESKPLEPIQPDPSGYILAASAAEAEVLVFKEREDLYIKLRAKPAGTSEPQVVFSIGNTISLMSVTDPSFLATMAPSSDPNTVYWEGDELDDNGEYSLVIRVLLSQTSETGLLEIVSQNQPSDGPPPRFEIATVDSGEIQLEIVGPDDISLFVVGTTLSSVLLA